MNTLSSVSLSAGPDTIFATASGTGRAAIAIVRLSGPEAGDAVLALAGALPPARRALVRTLRDPAGGMPLDEALVLWMPAPRSFTGEDVAEFHLHGGLAVRRAVMAALGGLPGCRVARPGEFTRRAFLNGRLDLTRAEGLGDLIDAETEAQRRQAMNLHEGALARAVEDWRHRLVDLLALIEASLDFSDEDDVPADIAATIPTGLGDLARDLKAALAGAERGERVREGYTVVLAGPTNAGKSTLLNTLAARDVAIVSAIPGTTRDAIETRCDLDGLPVTFVDTAGFRDSADEIEREGMRRTGDRAAAADLVLWLEPVDEPRVAAVPLEGAVVRVATKGDLDGHGCADDRLVISARDGMGVRELLLVISAHLGAGGSPAGDPLITRERHRSALTDMSTSLARATNSAESRRFELVAEDVRHALHSLGQLTGETRTEEVLDRVFARFCIGK